MLRIGVVVGEVSGDRLAAALIYKLKEVYSELEIEVEGIVGPALIQAGARQVVPMDELSVMGFVEPLLKLPKLLKIRKWIYKYFLAEPPDLFIGVDAPDFNLGLEKKIRLAGIPVVHYVSPSVWAWRQGRIHTIKNAVDLILTLYPFEEKFYQKHQIPVKFVGHPAADQIPLEIDNIASKQKLGYNRSDIIIGLLPGSRQSELEHMAVMYLQAANICYKNQTDLKFVMPLVLEDHKFLIQAVQSKLNLNNLPLQIVVDKSYYAMSAADIVLVTSGTATLEVMLHKKPMVIAYKTNRLTYEIVRRLIKVKYIGLPNLLSNELIAPEIVQNDVSKESLSANLLELLKSTEKRDKQIKKFASLHLELRKQASLQASKAIIDLLGIDL